MAPRSLERVRRNILSGRVRIGSSFPAFRALDIFEQPIRRIYLSATLESLADFIRAFGRRPDEEITPSNDAGNGERLVISSSKVKKGFGPDFAEALVKTRKAVIAVPSYNDADDWKSLSEPPPPNEFSDQLNRFRKSDTGAFVLVSRVDGIDLPHDTCRIMIIDGIPSGSSLIERYQWEVLRMNNVHGVSYCESASATIRPN